MCAYTSSSGSKGVTMYNYDWWSFDKDLMLDFNHFLKKINTRSCINLGFIDVEYDNLNLSLIHI